MRAHLWKEEEEEEEEEGGRRSCVDHLQVSSWGTLP
jgi:hypothetical protein